MKRSLAVAVAMFCFFLCHAWLTEIRRTNAQQPANSSRKVRAEANKAPRPNEVAPFMKLKLDHSQKVLEGLATENYAMIASHAQKMSLLTQDENWMVLQTPDYRQHSDDF